jgi:hypothetical protein
MLATVKDLAKLLTGIPKGAWVALSKTGDRVVAYAAELPEAIRLSKAAGEDDPTIVRVPESDTATLIL